MGFYDKLQQIATKVLVKFGTPKLTVVSASGPQFITSGAFGDLSFTDRLNSTTTAGSLTVTIPGNVPFVPKVGDYVQRGDGVRFIITRVDAVEPADTPVLYSLVVNK